MNSIPVYELLLSKTGKTLQVAESPVSHPTAAAKVLHALIGEKDREHFVCLLLNSQQEIIGAHIENIGGVASINSIDMRCVFRAAIAGRAAAVVFGHNHPSGDHTPSTEDIRTTQKLVEVGKVLGLPVLDHVIVTPMANLWTSLAEEGMCK